MGERLLALCGHGVRLEGHSPSLNLHSFAKDLREGNADVSSPCGYSAYMYRLSLEYVRILHHDEGDVDYVEMPSFNL